MYPAQLTERSFSTAGCWSLPIVRALLAQVLGGAAALALTAPLSVEFLVCQSLTAAASGMLLRLPVWWLPINALFVPLATLVREASIQPGWFLAGFVALAGFFWTTFRTRVPLFLSSRAACQKVAQLLSNDSKAAVLDIGCGFGGVLMSLQRLRPHARLSGVELAPLPVLVARVRAIAGGRTTIRRQDYWDEDLAGYDVVYAFLSPEPMLRLWQKVRKEMRPGSLFVSNRFAVPGIEPDLVLPLSPGGRRELYVWRL